MDQVTGSLHPMWETLVLVPTFIPIQGLLWIFGKWTSGWEHILSAKDSKNRNVCNWVCNSSHSIRRLFMFIRKLVHNFWNKEVERRKEGRQSNGPQRSSSPMIFLGVVVVVKEIFMYVMKNYVCILKVCTSKEVYPLVPFSMIFLKFLHVLSAVALRTSAPASPLFLCRSLWESQFSNMEILFRKQIKDLWSQTVPIHPWCSPKKMWLKKLKSSFKYPKAKSKVVSFSTDLTYENLNACNQKISNNYNPPLDPKARHRLSKFESGGHVNCKLCLGYF